MVIEIGMMVMMTMTMMTMMMLLMMMMLLTMMMAMMMMMIMMMLMMMMAMVMMAMVMMVAPYHHSVTIIVTLFCRCLRKLTDDQVGKGGCVESTKAFVNPSYTTTNDQVLVFLHFDLQSLYNPSCTNICTCTLVLCSSTCTLAL